MSAMKAIHELITSRREFERRRAIDAREVAELMSDDENSVAKWMAVANASERIVAMSDDELFTEFFTSN